VLTVDEDPPPLADEVGHRVVDHREVLRGGGPQGPLDVPQVGLGDQGDRRGLRVEQRAHLRVSATAAGLAGGAERDQQRVPQVQLSAGASEELGVLGHRAGPAALADDDPELVEQPGHRQLVDHRVAQPLALGTVAQRRVVDLERHGSSSLSDQLPGKAGAQPVGATRDLRGILVCASAEEAGAGCNNQYGAGRSVLSSRGRFWAQSMSGR
jgi:hypothetical protein